MSFHFGCFSIGRSGATDSSLSWEVYGCVGGNRFVFDVVSSHSFMLAVLFATAAWKSMSSTTDWVQLVSGGRKGGVVLDLSWLERRVQTSKD